MPTTQESVAAAFDKLEAESATQEAVSESAPVSAEPASAGDGNDAGVESDAGGAGESTATEAPAQGRKRDSTGKFVKGEEDATLATLKPGKKQAPKPSPTPITTNGVPSQTPAPAPGTQTPTPAPKFKAPASWGPLAKEHWATLHEAAQAEVDKREREISKALQESARPREFHQQFEKTVAPYAAMIQGDPVQYVGGLLQTVYALRSGVPTHRAQVMAQLIKNFDVPIDALDAALSGQAPPQGQAGPVDPTAIAAQVREQVMREFQQSREASMKQRTHAEVDAFGADREFFEDLRDDMAEAITRASRAGRAMTMEDAYNRAKLVHKADPDSEVGKVLRHREEKAAAEARNADAQRAKAASTSVRSQPAPHTNNGAPRTTRDAVEKAWDTLSGG